MMACDVSPVAMFFIYFGGDRRPIDLLLSRQATFNVKILFASCFIQTPLKDSFHGVIILPSPECPTSGLV